jgi:hypothetical protein
MSNTGILPEGISPEILLEKYRQQISHLKVFSLSKQAEQVEIILQESGNATELERQIWLLIKQKSN